MAERAMGGAPAPFSNTATKQGAKAAAALATECNKP
jgi:hypothetical protein